MKKERKMKLSKLKIAKINHFTIKGGVDSNACTTVDIACFTNECNTDETDCRTTTNTRNSDSL